ncbi:MAG: hypothetical protein LBO71_04485 [Prevotellaceae bacterium]|jgi:positive regulator of sigma E activity|nr:hypothetical protein [Prevotellaceae bacterium]
MLRANNEVMRLLFTSYTFATEVVLFEKLGENEVFATIFTAVRSIVGGMLTAKFSKNCVQSKI